MHFDERGTAFCALGFARATRRPAAWITTSGTAVANGMPAVVEASVDAVPMLLLTADRPPELRSTGANQTIDQVKLFGDFVRWQFDLPAPDRSVHPAALLTTCDQAVYRTRRMPAGPVHLNAMFREPLAPDPDGGSYAGYLQGLHGWREGRRPYTTYALASPAPSDAELDALWARLREARRGLVVAGRLDTPAQADAVRWAADRLGWPVLPDVGSQLRLGGHGRPARPVDYYDLVLASKPFRDRHRPDVVLHFGARSTSTRLTRYLADVRPRTHVVVRESPERMDPHHSVTDHFEGDLVRFCQRLATRLRGHDGSAAGGWADAWARASEAARRVIDARLGDDLSEPGVARRLSARVPEGSGLLLASSMPVRDADMYGCDRGSGPFVAANRGASGIDGTVATAAGLARGLRNVVTLLVGDLALLHDLNSLALLAASPEPVIVVVINNHGGGIFSFLPIARHADVFEPFFGTPHPYAFEHAARMFDLPYRSVQSLSELSAVYEKALGDDRSSIIEVQTDREANLALHRRMEAYVTGELER